MKIKKVIVCALAMGLLVGCGNEAKEDSAPNSSEASVEEKVSNAESTEAKEEKAEEKKEDKSSSDTKQELKAGEEWVVDGQWKLKVNSVKVLEGRNEYEESQPAQVVMVDYSYENLGFEGDVQDLFLTPERIIDGNGEMGDMYPAVEDLNSVKPTPVGAKMENAQEAFGLNNESDKVKIIFRNYVEDEKEGYKDYQATFEVDVEK